MENHFKRALRGSDPLLGIWISSASPVIAEALGHLGFDWMMFDTEHAPVDPASLQPLLQAASGRGSQLVARPAWNDPVLIKRFLDMGAETLLIPFVQTAAEAEAAVRAAKYPPDGSRGVAEVTRASGYGTDKSYFATANAETCILVQIETPDALERLEEIAAVDGVDGVFIGPSDLGAAMGYLGQPGHPEVQAVIRSAVDRLTALGKPAGILATTLEDARRYRDWGYRFVAGGVDLGLMIAAARQLRDGFR